MDIERTVFDGLVEVRRDRIGGDTMLVVDARELHGKLSGESKDKFADWIKRYTKKFIENQDYISFSGRPEKPYGGRPPIEYTLSLDMAKHLALMSECEVGHEIRTYFINCEKRLREIDAEIANEELDKMREQLKLKDNQLEDMISDLLAASMKANIVDDTYAYEVNRMSVYEFARTLQGVNSMMIKKSLAELGYLYKINNSSRYRVHYKFRNSYFVEKRNASGAYDIFLTGYGERLVDSLYRNDKLILKKGEDTYKRKKFVHDAIGGGINFW